MAKAITTYGLYNATFVRTTAPGGQVKQQSPWGGKLPTNTKSGGTNKYKK